LVTFNVAYVLVTTIVVVDSVDLDAATLWWWCCYRYC
jgi:hypothetical protein